MRATRSLSRPTSDSCMRDVSAMRWPHVRLAAVASTISFNAVRADSDKDSTPLIIGCPRALLCELAHLVRDDGKALPLFARARGFDGRIQREQVRLVGQLLDHRDEIRDALRALRETADLRRALPNEAFRIHEPLDGHADRVAMLRSDPRRPLARRRGIAAISRDRRRLLVQRA